MSLSVPGSVAGVAPKGVPVAALVADGYASNVFAEKQEQLLKVCAYVEEKGFIPKELVFNEVSWFYGNLGIDDMYFQLESVETIAQHIMALYGAKILAYTRNENALDINLERETDDGAVYINTSQAGVSALNGPQHEKRIDDRYLDRSTKDLAYRMESYRSSGTVSAALSTQLRCYFVRKCNFINPNSSLAEEADIRVVSDRTFLEKATENTLDIYSKLMKEALARTGPVIEMFELPGTREKRLVVAYKQRTTTSFNSAMSDLYHFYSLYSTRKYIEQFSNGITIMCLYLDQTPGSKGPPIEHTIFQVMKEASLIHCLPITPLQKFFQEGKLSVQECIYGYVGWIFAQHFLNRLGHEYATLTTILNQSNSVHVETLSKIKKRLRSDTFTREYILDIVKMYPELIKLCYTNFAMEHYISSVKDKAIPSLSYQRLQTASVLDHAELLEKIRRTVQNNHELMIFESYVTFNKHVLKTNFYQPTKVSLSFRLDPSFLPEIEYPNRVYGMFLVIGSEFRGFHLRFQDIARGGIRIVRSRNKEAYSINLRSLMDENYNLAATQQRKNKDIPEGGSKGTILLDATQQDKARQAFEKYVDGILDLLIVGNSPGIKERIVDLYKRPEILFFGPDEGTAEFMDWASSHARNRGATFWKAFTTGKSQSLGGIPHDVFGMTTRSVHQYVLGILRKLGIKVCSPGSLLYAVGADIDDFYSKEETIHKLQTGGPDGDLGSNEIKISKDKTIGIVDGSGVLYDPQGIDRDELRRLAENRQMIINFDMSKIGPEGFRVLVDETGVRLPNGTIVDSGVKFRNDFHLNPLATAELFVPCGGRPEAVDIGNVGQLLKEDGTPRFKYIVEGANLFFTQEARLRLEKAGVIIFKDASANKGGVTSSSLEVLAALAFTDAEFSQHMQVKPNAPTPQFYTDYIKSVHSIIEKNAELEFEAIWRESARTGKPKAVVSDELSFAIIKLDGELQGTTLWENEGLRKVVLREAFPNILLEKVGLEGLMQRVPETYVRAIFGSYLASRFVYKYGTEPGQFAFFEYMAPYFQKVAAV
ncbi:NAD-dependent glutamate dehydrogenase [Rhizophlyctis rosea]|uniref:NAD-specific glutamate dehydrogenase n=1 Tax=Rhizophlyctis rosea TaxID=64517 RepID=A0AAD5WZJ6_9FUNG|nr:NAD-dependent glutamate dehydrogenase [Rhizophlyctis rosea]